MKLDYSLPYLHKCNPNTLVWHTHLQCQIEASSPNHLRVEVGWERKSVTERFSCTVVKKIPILSEEATEISSHWKYSAIFQLTGGCWRNSNHWIIVVEVFDGIKHYICSYFLQLFNDCNDNSKPKPRSKPNLKQSQISKTSFPEYVYPCGSRGWTRSTFRMQGWEFGKTIYGMEILDYVDSL